MDKNSNEDNGKKIKYEDIFDGEGHLHSRWLESLASFEKIDDAILLILMLHVLECPTCHTRLEALMNSQKSL